MMRLALDTGVGIKIIRREVLPPGCESEVDTDTALPILSYGNGNPLVLGETMWLTVRLGNNRFRSRFLVAEWMTV